MLPQLHGDESEEDLERLYDELCAEEEKRVVALDALVGNKHAIELRLEELESLLGRLDVAASDSRKLATQLAHAQALAHNVSGKIRHVETVRGRVVQCVQRTNDLLDLKFCTEGVKTSMQNEEFEHAAGHIHRFLRLDKEILRQVADSGESCTLDESFRLLNEAEVKLKEIVHKNFDEAVSSHDVASSERFFKIFPLLNMHEEGLEKFAKYLSLQIKTNAKNKVEPFVSLDASSEQWPVKFALAMAALLEDVARIIEVHQPLIETYYGHGFMTTFIEFLQKECDDQSEVILREMRRQRQIQSLLDQVNSLNRMSKKASFAAVPAAPDSKSLDVLLGEVALVNYRVELFQRFVRRRLISDLETADLKPEERERRVKNLDKFLHTTILAKNMQQLIGYYVQLEEWLMRELATKAIQLDHEEGGGALTSSMVDDVFFVLKKSLRRSLSSGSADVLGAMLNHASAALEQLLLPALDSKLAGASSLQHYLSGDAVKQHTQLMLGVNNVSASCENLTTLLVWIRAESMRLGAGAKDKLDMVLSGLASVQDLMRNSLNKAMRELVKTSVRPRLKLWLESLGTTNFNMGEEELALFEASDPWLDQLIANLDQLISQYKESLDEIGLELFTTELVAALVDGLEAQLFKQTFSRVGALALERALRRLLNFLSDELAWSVRDRFTRLQHICSLLNVDEVSEVLDLFGRDYSWHLSPTEIRKVLTLRVDLSVEAISALKLT